MRNTIIITVMLACIFTATSCDPDIDISKYSGHEVEAALAEPLPEHVSILVGEEKTIPVHFVTYSEGQTSVRTSTSDFGIAETYELDDTTFVIKGVSEGECTVEVSCMGFGVSIDVSVSMKDLISVVPDSTSVNMFFGQTRDVYITVNPSDYPVGLLKVESKSADDKALNAVVVMDKEAGRPCLRLTPQNVGEFTISLVGMERGQEKTRSDIKVNVSPVPVDEVFFRVPTAARFVHDTISTLNGYKVITTTQYKFRKLGGSTVDGSDFPEGVGFLSAFWSPEEASVMDMDYEISYYVRDEEAEKEAEDGEKKYKLVCRWNSSIEDNDNGETYSVDPDELRAIYQKLTAEGYSLQEIADKIAEMNAVEKREPVKEELRSGYVRDFDHDILAWKISEDNDGRAEIKVKIHYISGVKNGKPQMDSKEATITSELRGRDIEGLFSVEEVWNGTEDVYEIR